MPTGLPAFVDKCPEYTVTDGRMQITMGDFKLVMPIQVFLEGCLRGKAAIAAWQIRKLGKVLPFPSGPHSIAAKLGGS